MALGLDHVDAVGNLLALGEVVVRPVGEVHGDDVGDILQFVGAQLVGTNVDLGVGEELQAAAVVAVAVGEDDFGHPRGEVAQFGQGVDVVADVLASVGGRLLVGHLFGGASGQAGIHQDDLLASVNQIVLKAAAIADVLVVVATFASHNERLGIESVFAEFYCFDFHII